MDDKLVEAFVFAFDRFMVAQSRYGLHRLTEAEMDVATNAVLDARATLDAARSADTLREAARMDLRAAVSALPQPTLGKAGVVSRGDVIDAIERVFAALGEPQ